MDNIEIVTATGETVTLRTVEINDVHYTTLTAAFAPYVEVLPLASHAYSNPDTPFDDMFPGLIWSDAVQLPPPSGFNAQATWWLTVTDWGGAIAGAPIDSGGGSTSGNWAELAIYAQWSPDGSSWFPNRMQILDMQTKIITSVAGWSVADTSDPVVTTFTAFDLPLHRFLGAGTWPYMRFAVYAIPGSDTSGYTGDWSTDTVTLSLFYSISSTTNVEPSGDPDFTTTPLVI